MNLIDRIADFQAAAVAGKPELMRTEDLREGFAQEFSDEEVSLLVVPRRTLARRIAQSEPLNLDETDRAIRIGSVTVEAERVFGNAAQARRWMRKPNPALAGQRPIVLLQTAAGTLAIEELLGQIDHGMYI